MSVKVDLLFLRFDKPEQQPQALLITMRIPFEHFAPFVFHQTGCTTNFVVLELPSKPLLENGCDSQSAGYPQNYDEHETLAVDSMALECATDNPCLLANADGGVVEADDGAPFLRLVESAASFHGATPEEEGFVAVLKAAQEAIGLRPPEMCREGEGATYFMKDATGEIVGVFKPSDGDPLSDSNPKRKARLMQQSSEEEEGESGSEEGERDAPGQRPIPKGGAAIREVAAYVIDRGFAGVPPTAMVRARSASFGAAYGEEAQGGDTAAVTKEGSFQCYVDHECGSWDVPSYKFSVADVHRIGILDLRILNTDRHGGNMLVVAKEARGRDDDEDEDDAADCEYKLVPIDHGYAFPTTLSADANFEWLYWPQARKPFGRDTLARIAAIDPEADAAALRALGLCEGAVRVNRACTALLKKGAAAGLTLAELGKLVYRRRRDECSPLAAACEQASERERQGEGAFYHLLDEAISALVGKKD